jgi:hypothetical protein
MRMRLPQEFALRFQPLLQSEDLRLRVQADLLSCWLPAELQPLLVHEDHQVTQHCCACRQRKSLRGGEVRPTASLGPQRVQMLMIASHIIYSSFHNQLLFLIKPINRLQESLLLRTNQLNDNR